MKKKLLFCCFFMTVAFGFSAETEYTLIFNDGTEKIVKVDENTESLALADKPAETKARIIGIKNLGNLKKLKSIELYKFADLKDFSFLKECANLETLYFAYASLDSFDNLKNLKKLRSLEICWDVSPELDKKVREKGIDLTGFKNLEKFTYEPSGQKFDHIPNIKVIPNKVSLQLTNNSVETFSESDIKILSQFKDVNISYNPVCKKQAELDKLKKAGIEFMAYKN